METIKITFEEYQRMLKIIYCTDSFLDTNNALTKKRLTEYINEFNNQ